MSRAHPIIKEVKKQSFLWVIVSFIVLAANRAFAEDPVAPVQIQIESFDPQLTAKDFGKGYSDHNLVEGAKLKKTSLPDRAKRDFVLEKSGIFLEVKAQDLDELDRDLLVIDAIRMPLKDLRKLYPQYSESVLKHLKTLADQEFKK